MRFPLRRAGVLLLVLVMCLAVVGVGYGKWSGTLKIQGDMTTAASAIKVGWTQATNSDEFEALDDSCGWNWVNNQWVQWHDGHEGEDHKHVGKTTSYCDPATLITYYPDPPAWEYALHARVVVILENAYPCYAVKVFPTLMNKGPLPAKIVSWTIYPDWGRAEGYTYTWDPDAGDFNSGAYVCPDYPGSGVYTDRPYNIGFSDGSQMTLLPDCFNSETFDLVVHVEQAALENAGADGSGIPPYTFAIEVHAEPAY